MMKMKMLLLIFLELASLMLLRAVDTSPFLIPYTPPNQVKSCGSSYRDSSSFQCEQCPQNQEVDPDTIGGDRQYSGCRCKIGYAAVEQDCSDDQTGECKSLTCTNCATLGQASYSDRSACVPCDDITSVYRSSVGDCVCRHRSQVLIEKTITGDYAGNKTCEDCPSGMAVISTTQYIAGKLYTADRYSCQACPDDHMSMTVVGSAYTCACASGYTRVGVSGIGEQSCVLTSLTNARKDQVAVASRVTYYDSAAEGTISSLTFEHYYLKAVSRCMFFGTPEDVNYCHQLANLCVLQLYDRNSQACADHLDIVNTRSTHLVNNIENWVTGMPWLYYGGEDANKVCTTWAYKKRVRLTNNVVRYVLAAYYMNGTFAGYQDLSTQLYYCDRNAPYTGRGGGTSRSTEWLFFGTNNKESFSCALDSLLDKEQMFYEMFIYRKDFEYTPVPVRITNIARTTSDLVNRKYPEVPLCETDDVLVRRFFLYDIVSGITGITSTNDPTTSVIRYASYISLEASLVTDKFARIYAPVLTITYKEVKPDAWKANPADRIDFTVSYTMNLEKFDSNFRIFFIIIMVFTGLLFALRYRNWQHRNSRVITSAVLTTDLGGFNMSTIMEMCLIASNTWVLVFFPVQVCVCWYLFTFFKMQAAPSVLLPPERDIYSPTSPYYLFVVNLHVMTFFQLWYVLIMAYRQCRADLFFIDWEPLPSKQAAPTAGAPKATVSVWRTILVANEWTELQTVRKTDIRFTLFFLAFVLLGANEEYNATHQPALENKSHGHLNIVLRFANTTFYWLVFSYAQYAWKFFLAERYFGEPPERLFVDFCTIAKISVIVLDEKYHGYYLHCRSPHQYADGTMTELVSMLHKEEAGLTVDRSLEGAPADVQTFQIFMSGEWREAFDKIRDNLVGAESVAEVMNDNRNRAMSRASAKRGASSAMRGRSGGGALSTSGQSLNNLPSEKVLKAWKEMLVFLQEFVENNFGKAALRRVVKEPTYYEKLTNGGPELSVPDQPSVFFTDRDYNYCKVWFLGRELELLTLNILSYSLFDLWFNSTCTSILLTYLLDQAVCYFRHYLGQAMISRKTLIDNRFLI